MDDLSRILQEYAGGPLYPLHMPGHKRRLSPAPGLPFSRDVTEVEGLDDLHEASGILKEAMDRTARLFGAGRTWYLVNGSTCGLLAGIRALAPDGSEVLVARNCHKSVFHAVELGRLRTHYIMPPILESTGFCGSISPKEVNRQLTAHPGTACVILTSPTYEGVISDIASIADICHRHGAALLVDEAHGAHLGLFPGWPDSAVRLGADLTVESAHKTLPSLTQTALLHLGKDSTADQDEIERQLDIFETSSPSYPLLESLDGCTGLLLRQGKELFSRWKETLACFEGKIRSLQKLHIFGHDGRPLPEEVFAFDPGKIPVCTAGTGLTGPSLADILRHRYSFETEMACGSLLLAMTSPADSREALLRFGEALCALDREAVPCPGAPAPMLPAPGKEVLPLWQALREPGISVPVSEAAGKVCAEYAWAYPPGIPLAVPGEELTGETLSCLSRLESAGTRIHQSRCRAPGRIQIFLDKTGPFHV